MQSLAGFDFQWCANDSYNVDMNADAFLKPKLGRISKHLAVVELIVRSVPKYNFYPELDGSVQSSHGEVVATEGIEYQDRLQGRLVNSSRGKLSSIKYDLSYYDAHGTFLGLDKSRFLEEDELDVDDHLPIDFAVRIPEDASECVFNVRAKVPGKLGRFFWG